MQNPCQKHTIDRPPIVYRPHDFKKPATPKTFLIIGHFLTIFFCPFLLLRMRINFKESLMIVRIKIKMRSLLRMIVRINFKTLSIMKIIIILSLAKIVPIIVYITVGIFTCNNRANNCLHNCAQFSLAITMPILLYITEPLRAASCAGGRKQSFVKTFQRAENGLPAMLNKGRPHREIKSCQDF